MSEVGGATSEEVFSLRQAVVTLRHKSQPDGLYVEDVVASFGTRSHYFLILFFSLPFIQPVPLLGLSTVMGTIIATLGILAALGKRPRLPQKVMRRHLGAKLMESCCAKLEWVLKKTEKVIRPRFGSMINSTFFKFFNAFMIAISALLLALPLPIPFSNIIPAYFLVVNALGSLEGDGLLMLLSYLIAIGAFCFFWGLGAGAWRILGT